MRIAAISDVHGNVYALEAVFADIERRGVELLVNLGDIFYGPIAPLATYRLLMEHELTTITGNQDRQLLAAGPGDIEANPTLRFVLQDLGREALAWLATLCFDRQVNEEVYLCHGTPTDDLAYLLEDVTTGCPRLRAEAEIIDLLSGRSSRVILCGHSHIPRTVLLGTGQLLVNPGSVGLPAYTDVLPVAHAMECYCPHASYALLEKGRAGWTVQHLKVPYDFARAARDCARRQRSDWSHCITTGRGTG